MQQDAAITVREHVYHDIFERATMGAQLPIRYVAGHPATTEIIGNAQMDIVWLSLLGPAIVWISLMDLHRWRRKQALGPAASDKWRVSDASIRYFERQQRK